MWHTLIDKSVSCLGGGQRHRRVATLLGEKGQVLVAWPGGQGLVERHLPSDEQATSSPSPEGGGQKAVSDVRAPMAARVLAVHAAAGDAVGAGQPLVVLEAMKMEHTVVATQARIIASMAVAVGDQVASGQTLVFFTPEDA